MSHFGKDATVDKILRSVRVHLVPTLNPDSTAELPLAKTKCDSQINTKNARGMELDSSFARIGGYYENVKIAHNVACTTQFPGPQCDRILVFRTFFLYPNSNLKSWTYSQFVQEFSKMMGTYGHEPPASCGLYQEISLVVGHTTHMLN